MNPTGLRADDIDSAPAALCHVWKYNVFAPYFDFRIYGRGLEDSNYGQPNVLASLRGCGVVTDWSFVYYCNWEAPDSAIGKWEWFAAGKLPWLVGMEACVRDALRGAGRVSNNHGDRGAANVADCASFDIGALPGLCPAS